MMSMIASPTTTTFGASEIFTSIGGLELGPLLNCAYGSLVYAKISPATFTVSHIGAPISDPIMSSKTSLRMDVSCPWFVKTSPGF